MDTQVTQIHDQFLARVNAARKYYESVEFTNTAIAKTHLEDVYQIIKTVPPSVGIEWLTSQLTSLYHPVIVADYEFPLDLLEYCFRSLRWKEGKGMLVEAFNRLTDPSYKLKLEVMIKRIYDPHWEGGSFVSTDLGPSIWDLLEEDT